MALRSRSLPEGGILLVQPTHGAGIDVGSFASTSVWHAPKGCHIQNRARVSCYTNGFQYWSLATWLVMNQSEEYVLGSESCSSIITMLLYIRSVLANVSGDIIAYDPPFVTKQRGSYMYVPLLPKPPKRTPSQISKSPLYPQKTQNFRACGAF